MRQVHIFENPAVSFFLGFIEGGERAKQLVSQADQSGAKTAAVVIAGSFALLGLNRIREYRNGIRAAQKARELETL